MAEEKKYKVIIVDDDKFLLDMYAMKFEKVNVEVIALENGEDLLNKLKQGLRGDLLLLDIIMPGMDGLTALEQIKKENLLKNMKVIMLTNQGDPEEVKKAKNMEIDGYMIKAITTPSEVVAKVMAILRSNV